MIGYIKVILAKRIKNGYQFIQKSKGFPSTVPLSKSKTIHSYPVQATLF